MIVFGDAVQGEDVRRLVEFGDSLGIPVKYVCLVDYVELARRAWIWGWCPDAGRPDARRRCWRAELDALWVVGANPLDKGGARAAGRGSSWCRICS